MANSFRRTDIWESAVPDRVEPKGWMGRYIETCGSRRVDHLEALTVGLNSVPGTFWTEMSLVLAVASISSFRYIGVGGSSHTYPTRSGSPSAGPAWTTTSTRCPRPKPSTASRSGPPQVGTNETYSRAFAERGTFTYFREPHPQMVAEVIVE